MSAMNRKSGSQNRAILDQALNLFPRRKSRKPLRRRLGSIENLERRDMMAADFGETYNRLLSPMDSSTTQAAAFSPVALNATSLVGSASSTNGVVAASAGTTTNNTFSTAANVGTVQGVVVWTGSVSRTDTNDYFRFALDEPGELTLRLDQLSSDIDLYLYNSAGQEITRSVLGGSSAEQIVRTLSAGTYYARVTPSGSAPSKYRITFDVDIAGETLTTARGLWAVNGHRTFTDWVGSTDKNDYFHFIVNQQSQVTLRLDNLSADVDLYLLDSSGRQVDRSTLSGSSSEQIQLSLGTGVYYAQITPFSSAQSSYRFTISVNAPVGGGTNPFSNVAYFGGTNDWNLNAINAPEVWARGYTGSGVVVAVLDTGVDYTHSELVSNIWVNSREIAGNGRDDDGNGFVDDLRGWDFVSNDNNPMDQHGHGTHVAGTIAAARNGVGSTGVAYGARIMPVQVIPASNTASTPEEMRRLEQAIGAGIRYAAANGADIINMSLHYPPGYSSIIASALNYASQQGVLVVVAAGNEAGSIPNYPAIHSAGLSNVLSVGAYASNNTPASFGNRVGRSGAVQVDAPGVDVYSTSPKNGYKELSGTSMATPHVAGIAALALSANRNLTPSQLRQLIVDGANRPIVGSDSSGGVNAALTVPLALAFRGSTATIKTGSDYAVTTSSPGALGARSLTSGSVDATMAFEFFGPSSRATARPVNTRVSVATLNTPQPSAARIAAFESWNADRESGGSNADESSLVVRAAFESAWNHLAAGLLEAAVA